MQRPFAHSTVFLFVLFSLLLTGCSSTKLPTAPNLLAAITTNPKLSQFAALVETAGGLGTVLTESGKHTIFAPSNEALEAMGEKAMGDLMDPDNRTLLVNVLRGHTVPEALSPKKVSKEGSLTNAMQKSFLVSGTEDNLMVGGGKVLESIKTKNGFVHIIDTVIKN